MRGLFLGGGHEGSLPDTPVCCALSVRCVASSHRAGLDHVDLFLLSQPCGYHHVHVEL
jgi:hypothetical protein